MKKLNNTMNSQQPDLIPMELIAPYLPYKLQLIAGYDGQPISDTLNFRNIDGLTDRGTVYKPLLRPLSDLSDSDLKTFGAKSRAAFEKSVKFRRVSAFVWIELLKGHYDVFNLLIPVSHPNDDSWKIERARNKVETLKRCYPERYLNQTF